MKTAYRNPRIENVDVDGNSVSIEISSQTGLSVSHARLIFKMSGFEIGSYQIECDNPDTSIPDKIANRIQTEIRNHVGIQAK